MIYVYGITEQGTYHVKNNKVCQDAYEIVKCPDDIGIVAVADGLGSEKHSDIASHLAVKVATKYCAANIDKETGEDEILKIICASFALAQNKIEQEAQKNGHELDQYDTTLSLAVLISDVLYYGHSGDSGIVALTTDGLYVKVTSQQRDEEGRVFPLFFGEGKWVFGKVEEKVASVFSATDGMFETLFPKYIRNEKVDIYVALARFFMDNNSLHIDEVGEEATRERIREFICSIPDAQVDDDKTVAVLVNSDIKTESQPDTYYAKPNWAELKRKWDEEWKREAYPHLFKEDTAKNTAENKCGNAGIQRTESDVLDDAIDEKSGAKSSDVKKEVPGVPSSIITIATAGEPKAKNIVSKIIDRIKDSDK